MQQDFAVKTHPFSGGWRKALYTTVMYHEDMVWHWLTVADSGAQWLTVAHSDAQRLSSAKMYYMTVAHNDRQLPTVADSGKQ